MSKVIVIGGGASGLISAIFAAKAGNDVMVLERNSSVGKKILVTGNGRCNYFNEDINIEHFHTSNLFDLSKVITKENANEVLSFFKSIGIIPKIKNGYYYPLSNQATSIKNALELEAKLSNVDIKNNILVLDVIKEDDKFKIITDYETYECDKVIMAMGSFAAPKTGSDGVGYKILNNLGHKVIKVLPSLVQLLSNDKITAYWDGVRSDARVSLYVNNEKVKEETGEIMLTNYGLSGICVFNLSSIVARNLNDNKKASIKINFLSNLNLNTLEEAFKWLEEYNNNLNNRTISELLDGLLNYKLVNALIKKLRLDNNKTLNELANIDKEKLIKALISYEVEVVGTNSFDKAQVCSGGIPLDEINLNTMESKLIPGLYIVGELLDVDGDCGGYNLGWAWISGIIAGKGTGIK